MGGSFRHRRKGRWIIFSIVVTLAVPVTVDARIQHKTTTPDSEKLELCAAVRAAQVQLDIQKEQRGPIAPAGSG